MPIARSRERKQLSWHPSLYFLRPIFREREHDRFLLVVTTTTVICHICQAEGSWSSHPESHLWHVDGTSKSSVPAPSNIGDCNISYPFYLPAVQPGTTYRGGSRRQHGRPQARRWVAHRGWLIEATRKHTGLRFAGDKLMAWTSLSPDQDFEMYRRSDRIPSRSSLAACFFGFG